ncbi:MAG: hypothetical protein IPN34_05495 [Planctomycetes bacterium]|nr:hypothetical protein [Planctomycetota bacterium]
MSFDLEAPRARARSRRWPFLLVVPALAVVAWPRLPLAEPRRSDGLEPLRVAYPQVRILSTAEFEALRGRCLVIDVSMHAPTDRAALAAEIGASPRALPLVFRAPRARAHAALEAALRARVAGYEKACAYLVAGSGDF